MHAEWIQHMRDASVADTAQQLGYRVVRKNARSLHTACPACGAPTRHTKARDR